MNVKDWFSILAAYAGELPEAKTKMNNLNDPGATLELRSNEHGTDSNNPDTWKQNLSRIATGIIIPLLIPTATAFAGWLANRRYAHQIKQNEALQEELTQLAADIRVGQIQAAAYPVEKPDESKRTKITEEEEKELDQMNQDLDELSQLLQARQDIYCSRLTSRKNRHEIEEKLKEIAFSKSYDKELRLYSGLIDIFQYDTHCDRYGPHKNGCVMWVYLDMWRTMARLRKHQRVDSRLRYEESAER